MSIVITRPSRILWPKCACPAIDTMSIRHDARDVGLQSPHSNTHSITEEESYSVVSAPHKEQDLYIIQKAGAVPSNLGKMIDVAVCRFGFN